MSDRIEAEILDVLGEEVAAAVDTPLVVIEGTKGDPGAPGKDGHSQVVTATKSGKTTTISVDGADIATVEDGADGAPGKNGADGKPGAAGADGVTPHIGDNGHWYLGTTDTGKPSRGEQGPGAEVYYVDLAGTYPSYTCATAMEDIAAAYASGKELKCRFAMGMYTVVLPLFMPMPSANTWIFSGAVRWLQWASPRRR